MRPFEEIVAEMEALPANGYTEVCERQVELLKEAWNSGVYAMAQLQGRAAEALRRLYGAVDGAFPLHGSPPRRDWHPDALDFAKRTLDLLDEVGQ